jgi:hypothetical protein
MNAGSVGSNVIRERYFAAVTLKVRAIANLLGRYTAAAQ